jgi:hypothetical protein
MVGAEQRLFAAHEDVLCSSPYFASAMRNGFMDPATRRIALPDEEPEIFSSVLEYLYKGDYFPRLVHNKRRNSWELEAATDEDRGTIESTVYHHSIDGDLLKDTVIYCAAERYGLGELKKLSLRKQGLRKYHRCLALDMATRPDNAPLQSPASSAVPFWHRLDMLMPTPQTMTLNLGLIILPSSSALATHSRGAAQCSWRCTMVAPSSSLIFLSL